MYQSGRAIGDKWDSGALAHGRFWKNLPNGRERVVVNLGVCRTRSIAERRLADYITKAGVNLTSLIVQGTYNLTFKRQAEAWLRSLANRKRNPVEESTIDNRRYYIDKWIYPALGGVYLADVNNLALKNFVEHLTAAGLAASSIRDYSNIVKAVVASALDENGEPKFPRKWNAEYIDAPLVEKQRQPTTTCAGMTDILTFASGQFRVLYALLAGCGPLRVGEALGLEVDKHISSDFRTLLIVQKAKAGEIQPYLKTRNGERQVDLCSELAEMLRGHVGERKSGLVFHTSTGAQLLQSNTLQDSLHPILSYLAHEYGGFNMFRRFRLTHLETSGCPEALKHFWSGHAQKHVSERYVKLTQNREYRLEWAEKIGLGFELPGFSLRHSGHSKNVVLFKKAV